MTNSEFDRKFIRWMLLLFLFGGVLLYFSGCALNGDQNPVCLINCHAELDNSEEDYVMPPNLQTLTQKSVSITNNPVQGARTVTKNP